MGINSKIAKIPFFILYLILAGATLFNWIRVILFQKDFDILQTSQPWDYHLSNFFSDNFGITQRQYFVFALPFVLAILYIVPKIFGLLLGRDKRSNIKGDNHTAIILILLVAPSALGLGRFFSSDWRGQIIPGLILIIIFSVFSWMDEKK